MEAFNVSSRNTDWITVNRPLAPHPRPVGRNTHTPSTIHTNNCQVLTVSFCTIHYFTSCDWVMPTPLCVARGNNINDNYSCKIALLPTTTQTTSTSRTRFKSQKRGMMARVCVLQASQPRPAVQWMTTPLTPKVPRLAHQLADQFTDWHIKLCVRV